MTHVPMRMCIICRQRFNKAELTRHTIDTQGKLVGDASQKTLGRGWYVCNHTECRDKFKLYKPRLAGQKGHKRGTK